MNLRDERIEELTNLIAARMPPRKIEVAAAVVQHDPLLPTLDQTPRARAIRRIADIAAARGWQIAVTRALDAHSAAYIGDLTDAALYKLRDRMEYFEDCAQTCCDPDDGLPAS